MTALEAGPEASLATRAADDAAAADMGQVWRRLHDGALFTITGSLGQGEQITWALTGDDHTAFVPTDALARHWVLHALPERVRVLRSLAAALPDVDVEHAADDPDEGEVVDLSGVRRQRRAKQRQARRDEQHQTDAPPVIDSPGFVALGFGPFGTRITHEEIPMSTQAFIESNVGKPMPGAALARHYYRLAVEGIEP